MILATLYIVFHTRGWGLQGPGPGYHPIPISSVQGIYKKEACITGFLTKNFRVYLMPSSPDLSLFENGLWTRVAVRTQVIVIHFLKKELSVQKRGF